MKPVVGTPRATSHQAWSDDCTATPKEVTRSVRRLRATSLGAETNGKASADCSHRLFTAHVASRLVFTQCHKSWVTQQTVSRPLHERHLHHQRGCTHRSCVMSSAVMPSPQWLRPVLFGRFTNGYR